MVPDVHLDLGQVADPVLVEERNRRAVSIESRKL